MCEKYNRPDPGRKAPTQVCSLVLPSPLQPFFQRTRGQPEFLSKKGPVSSSSKGKGVESSRERPPACREQMQQHFAAQNHGISGERNMSPAHQGSPGKGKPHFRLEASSHNKLCSYLTTHRLSLLTVLHITRTS